MCEAGGNMKKIETERKFIIEKPDIDILKFQKGFTSSEITQIYLTDSEKTHRIRKRSYSDGYTEYTENTKKRISQMSVIECESVISESEFNVLKSSIESGSSVLQKTRVTLDFLDKTLEIDIYPQWHRCAVLEVEIDREDEKIELPHFIKVIKDVTGFREYSNHSMAYKFPSEDEIINKV